MDDLKIGVEDEISQRMRVESSDVVRSCRPRGGGNRPQVVARVWAERTVRVFPEGTGISSVYLGLGLRQVRMFPTHEDSRSGYIAVSTHIARARWKSLHIPQRERFPLDAM